MAGSVRLDKYISDSAMLTRSEAVSLIKKGNVTVNGKVEKSNNLKVDADDAIVTLCGKQIRYNRYIYVMLNKPEGYVSATEDKKEKTVLDLLPEDLRKKNLFPAGRLDKNTLGLILLTNDGDGAHRLLSPKHHVKKKYYFRCKFPMTEEQRVSLECGATLDDGYVTKPSEISLSDGRMEGYITLTEGKYHQIKRMLESINNKITYLERVSFGCLTLGDDLDRGEWRFLTEEEIRGLLG